MKLFEITQHEIKDMSPEDAYRYTLIHGPTVKLEDIIATDAYYSYVYARFVLKAKFSKGEKAISSNMDCSHHYASQVLDSRFPEGEAVILKDPYCAIQYALNVLGRRWLKAESIIRKSNYWNDYKKRFNIT